MKSLRELYYIKCIYGRNWQFHIIYRLPEIIMAAVVDRRQHSINRTPPPPPPSTSTAVFRTRCQVAEDSHIKLTSRQQQPLTREVVG